MNICNFIQQQLRGDDFQIPPHRQAVSVLCHLHNQPITNKQTYNYLKHYRTNTHI